jgi:hypothetical protein
VFIALDSEFVIAKAYAILNNMTESHSHFDAAGKAVSYPVGAHFENVSDLGSLKKELRHHNTPFRGQIHLVRVIFPKPQTTEGHVKIS